MEKIKTFLIKGAHRFIRLICKTNLKVIVEGRENIPNAGVFLIVANHSSYLDAIVVSEAFFDNLINISWVVSKSNYRLWFLKWLWVLFRPIVVNGTIEKIDKDLDAGRWVVIFPEGGEKWCPPGKSVRKKPGKGAAVIALSRGISLIPVGISGTDRVLPATSFEFNPRHAIRVWVGKPFSFEPVNADRIDEPLLEKTTRDIMSRIRSLIRTVPQ